MATEALQNALNTQAVGTGLLDLLLNSVQGMVCIVALDGTYLFVSRYVERLTGFSVGALFGVTAVSTIHPDDRTLFEGRLFEALGAGRTTLAEYRQQCSDGRYLWCEAQFTPVDADAEPPSMVLTIIHDVSGRKDAEQQLKDSESRKAAMLDASLDAVIGTDALGRVVEWNASAIRIFGYARGEVLGLGIADLIVPDDLRPRHLHAMAEHRRTGIGHILGRRLELSALRKNGERFPCELTVTVVESGTGSRYIAFVRDLSEQHAASRRLRERDLQLRLIASQLPSILWTTDRDLHITAATGAGLSSIGVNPAEFIGLTVSQTVQGTPVHDLTVSTHRAALAGNSGFYPFRVAGREFDVNVEPFRDEHDQITGCLSLAVDVTDLRRSQKYEADKAGVLETIALGEPLTTTLRLIVDLLERQRPGSIGQAMLCTGRRLTLASAPRLPAEVQAILNGGLEVAPLSGSCGSAAHSGTPHLTADIEEDPAWEAYRDLARRHHLRACWAVPVLASDQTVLGTLSLYFDAPRLPGSDDLDLLSRSAHLAGIAMERARDLEQVISTREETLRVMGLALEFRDYETKGHTDRVVSLSLRLAAFLGIEGADLNALRWGAYLHDVGKIVVPDQVLLKPGKPTAEEWLLIQRHPEVGHAMLRDIPTLPLATLAVVRHHHERWDGSGYPARLAGAAIPWLARLFAVIDVYDALVNVRPYKRAWTHEEAMEELDRMAGQGLDPDLVRTFGQMMNGR
ncbi:PAS domain S-box protein [Deinococcus sp.]|uniref:PAS domain S-box protein n=1 Tax=Deinococcus sp. TaxID=47478 RepID=UPI003C7D2E87